MAFTVPFDLAYEFSVNARAAEVFAVLSDVPDSASHFPDVDQLVSLGDNTYRWELAKVGTAQFNLQTVYASRYEADKKKGSVVWTPVPGVGNALVGGSWAITARRGHTQLVLQVQGELQLPLPGLMKSLVSPVVMAENERRVEQYIANLITRFGGEHL